MESLEGRGATDNPSDIDNLSAWLKALDAGDANVNEDKNMAMVWIQTNNTRNAGRSNECDTEVDANVLISLCMYHRKQQKQ